MNQSFSMSFGEIEVILPKNSVKFQDDIGIATAYCEHLGELIGIVNSKYETIFPLVPKSSIPKIEIFSNNQLLIANVSYDKIQVFQCAIINNILKAKYDLQAIDFQKIDEDKAFLTHNINGILFYTIYSSSKTSLLTEAFHSFSNFMYNSKYNDFVTEATYNIPYPDGSGYNKIICYFNKFGERLSPYIDYDKQIYYDGNYSLEFIILMVKKTMEHTIK